MKVSYASRLGKTVAGEGRCVSWEHTSVPSLRALRIALSMKSSTMRPPPASPWFSNSKTSAATFSSLCRSSSDADAAISSASSHLQSSWASAPVAVPV